jgi:hypothetical protein
LAAAAEKKKVVAAVRVLREETPPYDGGWCVKSSHDWRRKREVLSTE